MSDFQECDECRAKPGSPTLCSECLRRRDLAILEQQNEDLRDRNRTLSHQVERITALEADLALARRTILELSERVAAQSELLSRAANSPLHLEPLPTPEPDMDFRKSWQRP